MKSFTVSFFGHRIIEEPLITEQALEKLVRELVVKKEYVIFLVGRDGEFDQLVSSVVRRCKRTLRTDNSTLVWVMPYLTAEYRNNEEAFRAYYDEIEICETAATGHFKAAIQVRNRSMVDRSNLAVFCVQQKRGGAWETMRYAESRGVSYINLNQK